MKKNLKERSAKSYGLCDKLYFTSDGQAYFDEDEAIKQADKLPDKTVISRTKEEADGEVLCMISSDWQEQMEEMLGDLESEYQ